MLQDVLELARDPERLEALRDTGLLDTASEESFDRLTRLAARLANTPLALVNLIAEDRQFSKSCFAPAGWPSGTNLPLADSFCKYALASREPLIIEDAHEDPRVASSRVVSAQGVRSYLGIPLVTGEGHTLGSLCVVDFKPRRWTPEEVEILQDLAASVTTEIELRAQVRETEHAGRLAEMADRERRDKTALLQSTTEGIYGLDSAGCCTFINAAGAEMLGHAPEDCIGQNMHALIHHTRADGTPYPEHECPVFRAYHRGESVRLENEILWRRDGTCFSALYSSSPIRDRGKVRGAVVTFSDITERKRDEEAQRLFSEAGKRLAASSLDYTATLRILTRLSVPALGDWCSLHMLREDGEIERLEVAHADPAREPITQQLKKIPVDPAGIHPAVAVLRSREPMLIPEVSDAMVEAVAANGDHRRLLGQLGMRSVMAVPLIGRGRALGSLTLVAAESGRRFSEQDLEIAREFAQRAALAVDNARLFQQSQEANQTKSEFLATVSHELRTPLNAVTGYAELLCDGIPEPLPEKTRVYVERIGLSAQHLLHLIDEILTFTRLEANRETVRMQPVDVQEVVAEIDAIITPMAEEKQLRFVVQVPDGPLTLRTDPGKLRQVLHNLLDNAVKFTHEGQMGLAVSREADAVIFRVWDTGIGIPAESQTRIFEPFRQLDQSHTRSIGGTGLGLTVTDRLVRILGANLTVASEPGKGSTFTVRFPTSEDNG